VAFLGARLRPGFEVVAEALGLARRLEGAQVAITGEGNYDRQTEFGKAPAGFLRMARESGCRTVLIAGRVGPDVDPPADVVFSLAERAGEEVALARAGDLVEDAAAEAAEGLREG
jgi:glycerate kinase